MDNLMLVYGILLAQGPTFAAALTGIVVAGVLFPKAPLPAKLVIIACVLEMLLIVVAAGMSGWFIPHLARSGETREYIGFIATAVTAVSSLVRAALFGLLIWAAFTDRPHTASTPR